MKILVAWYGSFTNSGTIGDFFSVQSLTDYLTAKNFDVDCACYKDFNDLNGNIVRLQETGPEKYDVLVFCCGPIIRSHPELGALFNAYSATHKIGIGVSLFPEHHWNYFNPFDFVLPRENADANFEDLAILAPLDSYEKTTKEIFSVVGLVLRNLQSEYGLENCKFELANSYLVRLAQYLTETDYSTVTPIYTPLKTPGKIIEIDNHLQKSGITPSEIEQQYTQCDIVLTTRFHGAVLALRNKIPFIALDQILNGAKVYNLLARTGYPFVWKINTVNYDELKISARKLVTGSVDNILVSVKYALQCRARETLMLLEKHLKSLS